MRSIAFVLACPLSIALHAQIDIPLQWSTCIGGSAWESALGVTALSDGGCVVVGFTYSWLAPDINHGAADFWVARLTAGGQLAWQRSLGGSMNDNAHAAVELANGDLLIAGYTESPSGDFGNGSAAIIVRMSADGDLLSYSRYGGSQGARAHDLRSTPDGGVIFVGSTASMDGDVVGHHGGTGSLGTTSLDAWLVKTAASGAIEWQLPLGGTRYDEGTGIVIANDGQYVISGYTDSYDGDVPDLHLGGAEPWADMWVARVSTAGDLLWSRAMGGSETERGHDISATSDGGVVVVGLGESGDGDLQGLGWATGIITAKVAADGDLLWVKRVPNNSMNHVHSVATDADGHHWITTGTDIDMRIVELGVSGGTHQNEIYGGSGQDDGVAIAADASGLFVAGITTSVDGDVSGNHGSADGWVLRFGAGSTGLVEPDAGHPVVMVGDESITVDMGPATVGRACELFDGAGRVVRSTVILRSPQVIATGDLAPGSYCAVVRTASGPLRARFELLH